MEEIADRRLAIFGALEAGHVDFRRIVDRFDRAFRHRNADQHPGDRLHHRLGDEPVAIGPAVLIMLEQNLVVPGDQQTGDGIARQIFSQGRRLAAIRIADVGRRTFEGPWRGGALDPPRRIGFIEMAECTDAIFRFKRVAGLNRKRAIGDRKTFRGSIKLGIRT